MTKRRAVIFFVLLLFLCAAVPAAAQTLQVDFYDVGKADAMLITTPQGQRMLIDTATNKEGKALAERLVSQGIDAIDVLLITHYDKDHVGGADSILERLAVGQVIMPVYEKESKQYTQFLEALEAYPPQEIVRMNAGDTLELALGDAQMTVTAAHETDYGPDEENDFSLAVRLSFGDTRFFFTGDAEDARQRELLEEGDVACDVLKTPYHGRYEKASQAFLTAASPQIAFITDSDEEPANTLVVSLLERLGAQVFCAKDGGVTVFSDGEQVWAQPME